ncbi:MAG TPA: NADH-quinone oxidoreductase subunit M [Chitinophagaceae bacterium]|nr:NADH-quinone oxidoreductase subunit M [Chitinophagaceae bacterium]
MVPVLLIMIPLITGLVSFFIRDEKLARTWALVSSLGTLAVSLLGLTLLKDASDLAYKTEWMQTVGSSFSVKLDGMGQLLCLLNAVAYPLVFIGTWHSNYKQVNQFFGLMLLAQAGMMGVFLAMDALLFYFFWELALVPMYFLCSKWGGEKRIRITFKFFIYTFVGSLLMLIGILYIQSRTAGQSFDITAFYNAGLSPASQGWIFWLFFLAFAIKMPVFPFHTWQPDTYEQAPTSTTMILSGVMVKMGLLGLLRWLLPLLPSGAFQWSDFVPPLALAGLIYASLIAIRQDDIKRLLAYSSIAHIGLMCAAVFTFNKYGLQGVMIQLFNHGVNIIGLWILVEIIERKYGTRKMSELGGLAQQAPAMAIFFVVISLANIALPLTNAFVGEFLMFNGLLNIKSQYYLWFTVMAGIGIILSAVYTLNMIRRIFYGEKVAVANPGGDLRLNEKLALGIIVILIFWLGIYPQGMLNITEQLSQEIVNKMDSISLPAK